MSSLEVLVRAAEHPQRALADTIDQMVCWAPSTVRARHYTRIADAELQWAIYKLYANDPIS